MATTERYTTVIELNSEQAKRNLDELRKQVESWKSDLAEAREKKMGKSFIAAIRKELREAENELKKYDNEVARTIDTLNNIGSASVEQLENAQKGLKRLASEVPHDSSFFQLLNEQLDMVTQELENIKATKAFEQMQQEAVGATKSAEQLKAELDFISQTADNAATASVRQLELAERTAQNIKRTSMEGSDEWNKAHEGLEKVRTRLTAIEDEERKVVSLIDRYDKEIKDANKSIEVTQRETQLVNQTLENLSSASVRDIEYSIKILNEQLRDTERNGDNVEELTKKLKMLNEELKKVQDMQKPDKEEGSIFTRGINFLNKNWGAITQVISAITGLSTTIRQAVASYADMEEAMADTRKYTGLSEDAIRDLNEDLKQMDTRTPREQLNELAGAAGRLGKTSKQDILEFVEAGDMIKVALGDDLGEGAIDKVGKLAMAFGEDDRMGLRGAMLATGSAVNELAQNSSAQAGFLVDFTARVAGFGKQLGLTQAQIMGFGAVMDENLLRDEMAATAFGNMLTKMQTDTAKFARIAGMDFKQFSELLSKDANQAILTLADSLKKADPQAMMKMLDDMGLDGSRAVGVLSTMADKIDDIRKRQELATEAYSKGTSVQEEFATMNNTVEAKLDKAKNSFHEMTVELGENLLPVVQLTVSAGGLMVKGLKVITEFVLKYKSAIIGVTAAIGTYITITEIQAHRTAIMNSTFIKAFRSMAGFKAALQRAGEAVTGFVGRLSLLKIATAGVIGVVAGLLAKFVLFKSSADSAAKSVEGLADADRAFNDALNESRRTVEEDIRRLKSLIDSNEDTTEAVKKLAEKYPQLVKEQMSAVEAYKALVKGSKDYCEQTAYEKKALSLEDSIKDSEASLKIMERRLESARKELEKYSEGNLELAIGLESVNRLAEENAEAYQQEGYIAKDLIDRVAMLTARVNKLRFDNQELKEALKATKDEMASQAETAKWLAESNSVVARFFRVVKESADQAASSISNTSNNLFGLANAIRTLLNLVKSGGVGNDTKEYWKNELDKRKARLNELRADAKATATEIKEAEKQVKEAQSNYDVFTPKVTKSGRGGHSTKSKEDIEKERLKKADENAKAETERLMAELTHRYAMGRILYCDYIEEQERIQLEGIERRMGIYKKESLQYQKLSREREEMLLNGSKEANRLTQAEIETAHRQRLAAIEQQAWRENMTEQQKNEMLFREDMRFLDEKRILYRKGTLERINLENEIEERQQKHKMLQEQYYQQLLEQMREQYLGMGGDKQKQIALKGLEELHSQGLLKEEEYQRARMAIQAHYAKTKTPAEQTKTTADDMLKNAEDRAKKYSSISGYDQSSSPIMATLNNYTAVMENLRILYANDEQNHAAYLAAKQQATAQFCEDMAQQIQAAYAVVGQVMTAASGYFTAQQDYETAKVREKYEKQIEAAGNNQKKVKKLQEKQQKEEAAIKTKYNKKQMVIQMAQAVAQTAINAISAYGAALKIGPAGLTLAPIAAAMAIAAGMLQIATIKKQQQAQEAGYYEGGFTGGRHYRSEAGVVHEGEFVANHKAVQNPAIIPFLNFLDQAQRNNTVGSITAADVSRQLAAVPGGSTTGVIAPVVNVNTDNAELREAVEAHREATERLLLRLKDPINAKVVLVGPEGLNEQQERLSALMKNK